MKKEDTTKTQQKSRAEQVNEELLSLTFLAELHRKNPEKGVEEILSVLGKLKLNA